MSRRTDMTGMGAGQGAVGGFQTGARIGSLIPGVGTIIGGAIGAGAGGIMGGFGGSRQARGMRAQEDALRASQTFGVASEQTRQLGESQYLQAIQQAQRQYEEEMRQQEAAANAALMQRMQQYAATGDLASQVGQQAGALQQAQMGALSPMTAGDPSQSPAQRAAFGNAAGEVQSQMLANMSPQLQSQAYGQALDMARTAQTGVERDMAIDEAKQFAARRRSQMALQRKQAELANFAAALNAQQAERDAKGGLLQHDASRRGAKDMMYGGLMQAAPKMVGDVTGGFMNMFKGGGATPKPQAVMGGMERTAGMMEEPDEVGSIMGGGWEQAPLSYGR